MQEKRRGEMQGCYKIDTGKRKYFKEDISLQQDWEQTKIHSLMLGFKEGIRHAPITAFNSKKHEDQTKPPQQIHIFVGMRIKKQRVQKNKSSKLE